MLIVTAVGSGLFKMCNFEINTILNPVFILIIIVSILSLLIGAIAALTQPLIKRVLTFSTVAQLGFLFLGLITLNHQGFYSFIFYLIQYTITNGGVWLCLIAITYISYNINLEYGTVSGFTKGNHYYKIEGSSLTTPETHPLFYYTNSREVSGPTIGRPETNLFSSPTFSREEKREKREQKLTFFFLEKKKNTKTWSNVDIRTINELQGITIKGFSGLLVSLSFSIFLFSLAGIPPFVGFFAKLEIISSAFNSGFVLLSLIAILSSLISAVYYLYIIKSLWFTNIQKLFLFLYPSFSNVSVPSMNRPETNLFSSLANRAWEEKSEATTNNREEKLEKRKEDKPQINFKDKQGSLTISYSLGLSIAIITAIITFFMCQTNLISI